MLLLYDYKLPKRMVVPPTFNAPMYCNQKHYKPNQLPKYNDK